MPYKYNPLLKHGLQEMPDASSSNQSYVVDLWQSFRRMYTNPAANITASNLIQGYIAEVRSPVTIDRVRCQVVTAVAVGNTAALGIYKYDYSTGNWDLIVQAPGTINLNLNTIQDLVYATPITLQPGIYSFVYWGSINCSMSVIGFTADENIFGFNGIGTSVYRNVFARSLNYTTASGIMPTQVTAAQAILDALSVTVNLVHKVV